jgi:hypothetical protein
MSNPQGQFIDIDQISKAVQRAQDDANTITMLLRAIVQLKGELDTTAAKLAVLQNFPPILEP